MKTKKKKAKPPTLRQMVTAARKAGMDVQVGLKEKMPQHFPDDHPSVTALLHESERITKLGIKWANAENPNPISTETCFRNGWAMNAAAAWLRVYLRGELTVKPKEMSFVVQYAKEQATVGWQHSKILLKKTQIGIEKRDRGNWHAGYAAAMEEIAAKFGKETQ